MKYSLGISNFLEEISSLSHSVVFLYFFALITEEAFLISPCYSSEPCIYMLLTFLFSFAFSFSSFLSYLYPQTTILPFCISFSWGLSWSLPPVQCHEPLSSGIPFIRSNPLNLFVTSTVQSINKYLLKNWINKWIVFLEVKCMCPSYTP